MFKRWFGIKVLLAFIAFAGVAQAQTATYYAEDLINNAKPIQISPGYTTLIEFYQEVDNIASGRPGFLKLDQLGSASKILLTPLANAGTTDLIVEIGARTLLFRVQITQGNGPRRYTVALNKPVPEVKPPAPAPQPVTAPTTNVSTTKPITPVSTTKPATGPAVSAGSTSAQSVTAITTPKTAAKSSPKTGTQSTTTKTPATSTNTAATKVAERNPLWLEFTFVRAQMEPDQVTMYFSLKNTGPAQVLIDPARLRATQNGQQLESALASDTRAALLKTGSTRIVKVVLKKPKLGAIFVSWSVFGPNLQEYALSRRINVTNNQVVSGN
jgi:hypothetical protein